MSDLIDVPDEQIEQIAGRLLATEWDWRVAGPYQHTREHYSADCPLCRPDYENNAARIVRNVAASLLPVLRAQIEAETRGKIGDEITAWRDADADERESDIRCPAEGHDCHGAAAYSAYTLAARLARGETNG